MPQVRKKAARDLQANVKTGVAGIVSRYKKKKAPIPEKMARLRGHLSSLIALKYGFIFSFLLWRRSRKNLEVPILSEFSCREKPKYDFSKQGLDEAFARAGSAD